MRCCTENQAVECSAGLWIGGKKTVVIMQNQGFYAFVNAIRAATDRLKAAGIVVSLFIDSDSHQVDAAVAVGAQAIEFHTGSYADAKTPLERAAELAKLRAATAHALDRGLHVHMGHGLNYQNVADIVRIPGVEELNIGHSIISRAVLVGLDRAVRDMKEAMNFPRPRSA